LAAVRLRTCLGRVWSQTSATTDACKERFYVLLEKRSSRNFVILTSDFAHRLYLGVEKQKCQNGRVMMLISAASSAAEFAAARKLFDEYAAGLGVDLCFQSFSLELENIATMYGPPDGCLLLARLEGELVGCVGFRRFGVGVCEMKRLYIKPAGRKKGIAQRLVTELLHRARAAGYCKIVLDTLPSMTDAQSLYRLFGFATFVPSIAPPLDGIIYMQESGVKDALLHFGRIHRTDFQR